MKSGDIYEGEFKNGKRTGTGTMKHKDGSLYTGGWLNGFYEYQGELREVNGSIYKGQFQAGQKYGEGRIDYPSLQD